VSLWDEPVRDVRGLATAERERLVHLLTDLSPDEWVAPTALTGWTVKDIALHLLDDDLTWLSMRRDGDSTGLVDMTDRATFPQLLAQKNQRWVDAAAVMSRQVVTGLLRWSGEQIDAFHQACDLRDQGWVSWASADPVPLWFNLAQEFTERWVHQQQVREAVGRVEDHGRLLPDVLNTFVWAFPHQLPAQAETRVAELVIEQVGTWTLRSSKDDGWSLVPGSAAAPDANLRLTADSAWRMLTGARMETQAITTEGDSTITTAMTKVRAIIV
jgi:uncharacterized protein (TIGR03083 family)